MAGPLDLTGQNIENTYQRILQTDGTLVYDGTGSLFNISGSGGVPGSPNTSVQFNGNGVFSGSSNFTFNSASNSLTLTGSLNVSGSTIQIGNNTLLGNTTLSGSIIISGALGTNNPTVKIYGDTTHNGYIRFDPVTTNINTTISASYIYVSGSTNDLYFSQNGNGYNNVTRLRWLEGNLYTGLLHGGFITTQSSTVYQVSSGSGIIVNLNASINNNPYPTIQYVNWPNISASIAPLSASYDQSFIAINSSASITAQGIPYTDGQYNTLIPIGIVIHQNHSTINAFQTFPSVGYGWKQRSYDFIKAFGPLKIAGYNLTPSSSLGLLLDGGTAWVDGRNYTIDPNNPSYITESIGISTSKIYYYYQSGSEWNYLTNNGAGYSSITASLYSNSGSLTPVGTNDWSLQRVFYFPNSATKAFYIYFGNATYSSKDNAIAGILTEPFNEAPNTAANAIFVGYMILRNNANFNTAASYEFRAGGLFRGISGGGGGTGGGGATTLAGLTDVSLSSLSYGDLLMYNASTGLWNNTHTLSGSYFLSGSLTTNDGLSVQTVTASFISASGGITGSLFGTASYALNGGVTQILAGSNITLSPTNGLGQVTINSTGGGGVYGNTATGSYGSFYDTTTQTNPIINVIHSMSINTTDISNGVSISGSTNPYNTYIKVANAGVYDIQFSAQIEKTNPGGTNTTYIWLRKNGIDLAETNTAVELSQNGKGVAAWNWFINAAANDYYQIMWSSNATDTQLTAETPLVGPAVPSVIVTANRIDQFLSNTGSFSGSFTGTLIGTASWANTASISLYPINVTGSSIYSTGPATGNVSANNGIFLGGSAGGGATNANLSVFLGYLAGQLATNANEAIIIGPAAGLEATKANNSVLLGSGAGYKAVSASYSTIIGSYAGSALDTPSLSVGTNNIIIGNYVTLPSKSRDSINLGGIIFATGSYSTLGTVYSGSQYNIGKVGINKVTPNYTLDVSGSGNYTNGLIVTGSLIAPTITGSLQGTASYAITASYVDTLRAAGGNIYAVQYNNSSGILVGSNRFTFDGATLFIGSGSLLSATGSLQGSSSYALTASYALNGGGGAAFPYTGSAEITGSLILTGSFSNDSFAFISGGLVVGTELGGYVQAGNHKMQIVAEGVQTPLTIEGGSGTVEIWKDTVPTKASAFGMSTPGAGITDDFIFSMYDGGAWGEAMRIRNMGFGVTQGSSAKATGQYTHAEGRGTQAGILAYTDDGISGMTSGIITLDAAYGDVSTEFTSTHIILQSLNLNGTFYLELDNLNPPYFNGTNTIVTLVNTSLNDLTFNVGIPDNPIPNLANKFIGDFSHAEGWNTITYGVGSHAAGYFTVAVQDYQNVVGHYNILDNGALFIIGNGDNITRSNLFVASGSIVQITGSLEVTGGITGSFSGSFTGSITNATTASYATNALSASYTIQALSSSFTSTASYVNTLNQSVNITGNATASIFVSTNNGNGTNFKVGDDAWIGDINTADTFGIKGQQNATKGYIKFGSGSLNPILGSGGTSTLELTGSLSLASGSITLTTGSITMPNRPAFRVYGSSVTGITATTTITATQGATVDYNKENNYNNTTGIFTAPVAGLYHVFFNCRTQTAGSQQVIVYKNTSTAQMMWETNTNSGHFGVSSILNLAANDTLEAKVTVGTVQFDANDNWGAAYIG